MTVTKADLANTLFEQIGLNKREANKASQKVKDRIAKNNVSALDGKSETNQL